MPDDQATDWQTLPSPERRRIAQHWLDRFNDVLARRQYRLAAEMLHSDGYWRDLMTCTWEFRTNHGHSEIRAWLAECFAANPAYGFQLAGEPTVAAIGEHPLTLEFFFTFETALGLGRGHARLAHDGTTNEPPRAVTLLTTLQSLKAFPERVGRNRPREDMHATSRRPDTWLAGKPAAQVIADSDPDVLIVGAGQSGLMLAARLRQLGIGTLLVERSSRVGDIWRKRYNSLKLHNDLCMNHFPYLPFPDTWPAYLPKDKVADWFEFYARAMELDVWTDTSFVQGALDPQTRRWRTQLRLADGTARVLRPRHLVMAVGVSGLPSVPELPGMNEFGGIVLHSSGPVDDLDVKGKKILVVGAGTSAHDIAQNFCLRGASVTMLQRSSITVVSLEPSAVRAYEMYRANEGVRPINDIDMMAAAVPYELLARLHRPLSRSMQEADKELLDGLRRVGFLLDNGGDDTGYFLKLLRQQAGYYLNIGASELIIEGRIGLKAGTGLARLTADRAIFADGTSLDIDVLVLATGYKPLQEQVRALFGDEVAERVGPIWGIGEDGELRNMYAPTAQENFFVLGGGFPAARYYSQFTALYIKADLEGLLPAGGGRESLAEAIH